MPVINRKRPTGGAVSRLSGCRPSRHEEEDHDMDQESEEEEDDSDDEEDEAPPARRRGQPQQARPSKASRSSGGGRQTLQVSGRNGRARQAAADQEEEQGEEGDALRRRKRRRRREDDSDEDEEGEEDEGGEGGEEDEEDEEKKKAKDPVAKFVRLALACEYTKKPIRRAEITEKVLMPNHKNDFKTVFDQTQAALRQTFGMELAELPANREKQTLNQQRRAAAVEAANPGAAAVARNKKESASAKSWVLTSVLPDIYRDPEIIAPFQSDEQALHGFGMMIVTMVYLSKNALSGQQLDQYLKRFKSEETIAVEGNAESGKTDVILQNLIKNGYLVKVKDDKAAGEQETFTYKVGPRAKVEMGKEGVMKMVRMMYGDDLPENYEKMVAKSMGLDKEEREQKAAKDAAAKEDEDEGGGTRRGGNDRRHGRGGGRAGASASGGGNRRKHNEEESEEEEGGEEEDDDEDDDDE